MSVEVETSFVSDCSQVGGAEIRSFSWDFSVVVAVTGWGVVSSSCATAKQSVNASMKAKSIAEAFYDVTP